MRIPLPHLLILALASALASSARAEDFGDRGEGFTFQVVTAGKSAPEGLRFLPDGESDAVPLVFHPSGLSETYDYAGESPLKFFSETLALGENALKAGSMASFEVPAEGGAHILIFVGGSESGSWSIRSLPLSEGTLAPTAITFYNGLDSAIEASVAEQPVSVEPGLAAPHSIAELTHKPGVLEVEAFNPATGEMATEKIETLNEGVHVVLRPGGDSEARPFYDGSIPISLSQAYLMLIFPPENPDGRRYRVKVLSVTPPKAADEE